MKPTPELIFALRRAAVRIRDPKSGYDWGDTDNCNCGLLVRELLGLAEHELSKSRFDPYIEHAGTGYEYGYTGWDNRFTWTGQRCKQTGLPFDEIMQQLHALGLEESDFKTIEWCGGAPFGQHEDPAYVSTFFENIANDLEAQLTGTVSTRDDHEMPVRCLNRVEEKVSV